MKRVRYQNGSVFLDRRRNIWYFKWWDGANTENHTTRSVIR